jgi:aminoglycoside phosphotransferase (APT) family kinase protein
MSVTNTAGAQGGAIDEQRLAAWMDAEGVPGQGEPLTLTRLSGGSQNELFALDRGGLRTVLRMPPPNASASRADGLRRELRLVAALRGTDVPHAELVAGDATGDVLGMPFYVMRAIDGWCPADSKTWPAPFDADLEARRGLAFELVDGIARLSRVDWRARGLEGFGRPEHFHERQVDRWLAFLADYRFRELPGLDEAADWLRRNPPRHYQPGIMHGDYQFANVMFDHGAPAKLAAIIDWEMTTIGDPLLDLGWALIGFGADGVEDAGLSYTDLSGMPARDELLAHYEQVSGRSTEDFGYYMVLARWKLGVVLEKSYAAFVKGEQVDPKVEVFGDIVTSLISTSAEIARTLPGGR